MAKLRHPLSGAIYDRLEDGRVRVDAAGRVGVFTADGRWQEGELKHADPHLCGWLAGRRAEGGRYATATSIGGESGPEGAA